jgi:pimeloyl-ACP methyl ester carboxylesterase
MLRMVTTFVSRSPLTWSVKYHHHSIPNEEHVHLLFTSVKDPKAIILFIPGGMNWKKGWNSTSIIYEQSIARLNLFQVYRVSSSTARCVIPNQAVECIHRALLLLRKEWPHLPLWVVGVSIGGYLIGKYLQRYDDADRYFPCVTNWCYHDFSQAIDEDPLLKRVRKKSLTKLSTLEQEAIAHEEKEDLWESFQSFPRQGAITFVLASEDSVCRTMLPFIEGSKASLFLACGGYHFCYLTVATIIFALKNALLK